MYNDKERIAGTTMNVMRQKRTSATQTPTQRGRGGVQPKANMTTRRRRRRMRHAA